jgi:hypothetical protein
MTRTLGKLEDLDFFEVKEAYRKLRVIEKNKIIGRLLDDGWSIMNMMMTKELSNPYDPKAGCGLPKYTSDGAIVPYDLRNWQWINAMKDGVSINVGLQSLDFDEKTGNIHALLDRVSIYNRERDEGIITEYDLPLSNDDLDSLISAIRELTSNSL